MNPILRQLFEDGVCRYYPYEIGNRLVIRVFQSFVIYYLENTPDSINLSFIEESKDGLKCFDFKGNLLPLCYSIPYDGLKQQINVK